MKISSVLLVTCLAAGCLCGVIKEERQEEQTYCTDEKDPDFRLAIGQQGPSPKGTCMLVKCREIVEGKSQFTRIGCGVFVSTPGCKVVDDKTKPYPDCCPNEICDQQT